MHVRIIALAFGAAVLATSAFADTDSTVSATTTGWSTASHFGFAVADRSTTGFSDVGGSLVFFDLTHRIAPNVELGLRSVAEGGHGQAGRQFYRLATGPLCTWKVDNLWMLQVALNRFEETGMDQSGGRLYGSKGYGASLGFERIWRFDPRVEAAAGAFVSQHQGDVEETSPPLAAATQLNYGLSHGLEVSLRVHL